MSEALLLVLLLGCSAPDKATDTLHKAGYSEIQILGWDAFECGKDDFSSTGFSAVNPVGVRVEGVVCCGVVAKGCTIRF